MDEKVWIKYITQSEPFKKKVWNLSKTKILIFISLQWSWQQIYFYTQWIS